jgi:hypothetical protein
MGSRAWTTLSSDRTWWRFVQDGPENSQIGDGADEFLEFDRLDDISVDA